jgi:hypothetical protein
MHQVEGPPVGLLNGEGELLAVGSLCLMTHVFITDGRRNWTLRVPTRLGSSTLVRWPAFGKTSISHPAM